MKLREEEFYEQYHQHGGTTIIPTEIFNELYDDATEEIERQKEDKEELQGYYDILNHQCIEQGLEIERLKDDNEYLNKVNIELSSRNSKAIEYIETHQLNFKKNITTFGSERLSMEERKLLDILRGVDKE